MSKFLTELDARLKDDDRIWVIESPLVYESDIIGKVRVPVGFETDFASVPRVPVAYWFFGDKAHREAVIHDFLYRINAIPNASFNQANAVFLEAMAARNKPCYIRYPMYLGVCVGGRMAYHKRRVEDKL